MIKNNPARKTQQNGKAYLNTSRQCVAETTANGIELFNAWSWS